MKRMFCMALSLLLALSLVGCGKQENGSASSSGAESASSASSASGSISADGSEVDGSQTEDSDASDASAETETASLFGEMAGEYMFANGAGAWSTVLELQSDGSFSGQYHDSDMGAASEDYPNGMMYICDFTGTFSEPVKVDDYTYSTALESLDYEGEEGMEFIKDGMLCIYGTPYGLIGGDEFLIYLPGKPVSELPEGFSSWSLGMLENGDTALDFYSIWNVSEQQAFIEYDS